MVLTLDGASIMTAEDVHRALDRALGFGSHYGFNVAALYDRLSRDVPRPVHVVWTHSRACRERLGDDFAEIVSVFQDVADEDAELGWDDRFTYELR